MVTWRMPLGPRILQGCSALLGPRSSNQWMGCLRPEVLGAAERPTYPQGHQRRSKRRRESRRAQPPKWAEGTGRERSASYKTEEQWFSRDIRNGESNNSCPNRPGVSGVGVGNAGLNWSGLAGRGQSRAAEGAACQSLDVLMTLRCAAGKAKGLKRIQGPWRQRQPAACSAARRPRSHCCSLPSAMCTQRPR